MTVWATRCTQCGTSFRVNEEQLAISEGLVRCGRCDAVFDARATLFDLDAAATPSRPMPLDEPATPPQLARDEATDRQEPRWGDAEEDGPAAPAGRVATEAPLSDQQAQQRLRDLLGVLPPAAAEANPAPEGPAFAQSQWASLERRRESIERTTRWPLALGSVTAAALALALPLQWAWIERDALLARSPRLEAWVLAQRPDWSGSAWQRVEGLSVAASSLTSTPQGGAYLLELTLHNRAAHALAMPWLDLSLSDARGSVLVRRALSPQDLGVTQRLAAGEQRRVRSVFRLESARAPVAGYEIGLFHP